MKSKLGIVFNDNDFHNAIVGFLRTLHDGLMWNCDDVAEWLTKEMIADIFNSSIWGIYCLYQRRYLDFQGWKPHEDEEHAQRTRKWLQIKPEHVLFDEEVDEHVKNLKEKNWGNGEFNWYDYRGTLEAKMTGVVLEPVIMTL